MRSHIFQERRRGFIIAVAPISLATLALVVAGFWSEWSLICFGIYVYLAPLPGVFSCIASGFFTARRIRRVDSVHERFDGPTFAAGLAVSLLIVMLAGALPPWAR